MVKKRFALINKKLLVRKSYVSCKKKSTMQFASSSIVSSIDFSFRVNNTNISSSKMMQSIFTIYYLGRNFPCFREWHLLFPFLNYDPQKSTKMLKLQNFDMQVG